MDTTAPDSATLTPFDRIGGAPAIERLVNRFYDLMDQDPRFAGLRAMHAADLGPMRRSLAGFLAGWAGGPRDWFEENPGRCMMSAHAGLPIDGDTARQWLLAMDEALVDCGMASHPVGQLMAERFRMMAGGMARMAGSAAQSAG